MLGLQKIGRHADLMKRMGRTVGVDFGRAIAEARLSPQELRTAVLACAACDRAGACDRWIGRQADDGADRAPAWCINSDLMAELAEKEVFA